MKTLKDTKARRTVPARPEGRYREKPTWQRIGILALGDAVAFLAFAAFGRHSHGEASGFAPIPEIIVTALPFAAGWFIVAPFVGVYRRAVEARPRAMVIRTLLGWLAAWPLAFTLRGLFVDHAVPPFTFGVISLVANAVLLLVWRWPYAFNNHLRQKE